MTITRRDFLRTGAAAAASLTLLGRPARVRGAPAAPARIPIAPEWTGDRFDLPHKLLMGGAAALPAGVAQRKPEREFDAIVVGGGLSGLAAAYKLRDRKVLLLESGPDLGGAARKGEWGGIRYCIGSAYFLKPEAGEPLAAFYREIGADKAWRIARDDAAFFRNRLLPDLWRTGTARANRDAFRRAGDFFQWVWNEAYCDVPFDPAGKRSRAEYEALDRQSLGAYLRAGVTWKEGRRERRCAFDPAVLELVDLYCISSMGGRMDEVSAWYGLNFLTAEFGDVAVLPGGNWGLVDLMARALGPQVAVETGRVAVKVRWDAAAKRAAVTWATAKGGAVDYHVDGARAVVIAAPKCIAQHVVEGLPAAQRAAMARLEYRPYVVANALVKRRVFERLYDGYVLDGLDPASPDFTARVNAKGFSDVICANWAERGRGAGTVLTLYRGITDPALRGELLGGADAAERWGRPMADQLAGLLAANGVAAGDVQEIRMSRWGHPMVLAKPGQLVEGVPERASQPLGGVFFAQQDTWGGPAVENSLGTAFAAAEGVRKMLG